MLKLKRIYKKSEIEKIKENSAVYQSDGVYLNGQRIVIHIGNFSCPQGLFLENIDNGKWYRIANQIDNKYSNDLKEL